MAAIDALADLDLLPVRLGSYRTGNANALRDANLLAIARQRRREMSQRMVPFDADAMNSRLPEASYFISRKVDGEFTVLVYREGQAVTLNPYGTTRAGAPFHIEAAKLLQKAGVKRAIIGGELNVRRPDKKRARVHDVVRVARAPKDEAELGTLAYTPFSIYDLDGIDLSEKPGEMHEMLKKIFGAGDLLKPVETVEGDRAEVVARFKRWVEGEGEEGLVVRSPEGGWYKIKPRHTLDVAVVGYSEGTEDRAGMLHSLLLAVVRDDGSYHIVGRTGGGFSDDQRRQFLLDLAKRVVDSEYTEVNSDRVAYRMIEPGLVAQISCLDLITSSSEGEPIERMLLEWNAATRTWIGLRHLPLVSIISPQFERFRDDKSAKPDDVGLSQLTRIVELPEALVTSEAVRLPSTTLMRRAVATKELKGKTMVRKLLMLKTNKEQASDKHPAYVLVLTDYSPNRKTPLERDIRVSSSAEQIEAYWQQWQAEQFVKGWVAR